MRVLIVDDEIETGELLQRELQRQGCQAEYTTTAADVLPRLSETAGEPCEVLILNLDMPGGSGLELLEKVKEIRLDLDVIVITAGGDEDQAMEAIHLGAIDYLRKPISLDELRTALFRIQQKRSAQGRTALKHRVLVVDDEKDLAARMKQEMEREGYEVAVTYDGLAGLEYFKSNHVDAVIADIRMSGMDGLEMLDQCRRINPDFVSIVITGFGDHEKAVKSLKLGVFDYLRKPISVDELISAVGKGIDLVALRRGLSAHQRELEIESALKTRYAQKLEREKEAAQKSEEKYRTILENIEEGYYEVDIAGYFRFFNDSLCKILGYPRDELMHMNNRQNTDDENTRKVYQTYNEVYLTGKTVKAFDWEIITKEGVKRYVEASISLISGPTSQPTGFRGILRDITERKFLEDTLKELYAIEQRERRELEEEARVRGQFINVLAHEMRTPLTPVLLSAGMLVEALSSDPESAHFRLTNNILDGARSMASRLDELLDLARLSAGTFILHLQPLDTRGFFEKAASEFQPVIEHEGQHLIIDVPPTSPIIHADPSRLQQVLLNLLSNASKFSPEGSTITLRAMIESNKLVVEIEDQGIGISPEEQESLFKPYHRVKSDRQTFPGLGLGLAIARQIIEAHGGRMWLTSQPGQGSTFSFSIPLTDLGT